MWLIERRTPTEFALRAAVPEGGGGIVMGLALFCAVMAVLWLAGAYRASGFNGLDPVIGGLVVALVSAVSEEILFRGLAFRALCAKVFGTWGALAITSILFGAAHGANPGATLGSSVAVGLEAGLLLGAAYAVTQRLWLPIGLHLGWNFAEATIFGTALSGFQLPPGVIAGKLDGPTILTGGSFGPEASIAAVIVCVLAAAWLLDAHDAVAAHRAADLVGRSGAGSGVILCRITFQPTRATVSTVASRSASTCSTTVRSDRAAAPTDQPKIRPSRKICHDRRPSRIAGASTPRWSRSPRAPQSRASPARPNRETGSRGKISPLPAAPRGRPRARAAI